MQSQQVKRLLASRVDPNHTDAMVSFFSRGGGGSKLGSVLCTGLIVIASPYVRVWGRVGRAGSGLITASVKVIEDVGDGMF